MKSLTNGQGYYLNDNRHSGGARVEDDVLGCKHCQGLILKREWREDGGFCHCCDAPICASCADRMLTKGCENFARQVENKIEENYRARQNAIILGL